MSEGRFALLEGCVCHVGTIIIVFNSFLAPRFVPLIVSIISFAVVISLWQSYKPRKDNNNVLTILRHQLFVLFSPLVVLVALLDVCTLARPRELLSLLQGVRCLCIKRGVWYKKNARRCKLSSPWILYLVSRLVIHVMPGGCISWWLGCFVFIYKENAGNESKLRYLTSWMKKSPDLEYIYPFFLA
jgi:hypothetical protein